MDIYLAKDGASTGPFAEELVRTMLAGGQITSDTLAWREGAAGWLPLRELINVGAVPPLPSAAPVAPAAVVAGPVAAAAAPISTAGNGPSGIGGWLLFFCVALTILAPLATISSLARGWQQAGRAFEALPALKPALIWEDLGFVAVMLYGLVIGILIWRGHPKGRDLAKQYLLIRLAALFLVEAVGLFLMRELPARVLGAGTIGAVASLFVAAIFSVIWWFYFKKSKRVANTYGPEPS